MNIHHEMHATPPKQRTFTIDLTGAEALYLQHLLTSTSSDEFCTFEKAMERGYAVEFEERETEDMDGALFTGFRSLVSAAGFKPVTK